MSGKPKEKITPSVYSSVEKLRAALEDYLLTNGEGKMGRLISRLVRFHKSGQVVKFVCTNGNADHSRKWVNELLERWGIKIVGIKDKADISDTVHELEIPDLKDRRRDLPLMIAYYFEDFLHRHEVARSAVREVSLDLLWYMLGHPNWKNADNIKAAAEMSIVDGEGGVLTLCQAIVSARRPYRALIGGLEDPCKKLEDPHREQKALGFLMEHPRLVEEHVRGKYVEWYLNWERDEAHRGNLEPRVPRIPTNKLFQAMTNIYKLSELSQETSALPDEELRRIEKSFALRRQGFDEEVIAERMEFQGFTAYQYWTEQRHINIRFRRRDNICAGRDRAKAGLLPPSEEDHDTLPYRESVVFDDVRHVVTIDGSPHELSPEQFRVYKCLVESFPKARTWRELQSAAGVSHQQMAHSFSRKKAFRESIIKKVEEKGAKVRWKAKLTEAS